MNKNIYIIGSGFSSLAASCYMSKMGYNVTVLEKNNSVGGRARQIKKDGFIFDIGPSWYWMPGVFERFFADFGRKPSDYYKLEKLGITLRNDRNQKLLEKIRTKQVLSILHQEQLFDKEMFKRIQERKNKKKKEEEKKR